MKNYKLKELRDKNKYTQSDMSNFLGISSVSYRNKENGLKSFTQKEIDVLLKLFGVKYEDMF